MTPKQLLGLKEFVPSEVLLVVTFLIFAHWSSPPKERRSAVTHDLLLWEKILRHAFSLWHNVFIVCSVPLYHAIGSLSKIQLKSWSRLHDHEQMRSTVTGDNGTHYLKRSQPTCHQFSALFSSIFFSAFEKRRVFSVTSGLGQWL